MINLLNDINIFKSFSAPEGSLSTSDQKIQLSFQSLKEKYKERIEGILSNKKWEKIIPNKIFFHFFLDKADLAAVNPRFTVFEWGSQTFALKELIKWLQAVEIQEPLKKTIDQLIGKVNQFLDYAQIIDGMRCYPSLVNWAFSEKKGAFQLNENVNVKSKEMKILAEKVCSDLLSLKRGDYLLLPGGSLIHESLIKIFKNADGSYSLFHFNTGDGALLGKTIAYQSFIFPAVIESPHFWQELFSLKVTERTMDRVLEKLSEMAPWEYPNPEHLVCKMLQTSNTCSLQCLEAFLRALCVGAFDKPSDGLLRYKLLKGLISRHLIENAPQGIDPDILYSSERSARVKQRYLLWNEKGFDAVKKMFEAAFRDSPLLSKINIEPAKANPDPFIAVKQLYRLMVDSICQQKFDLSELHLFWDNAHFAEEFEGALLKCENAVVKRNRDKISQEKEGVFIDLNSDSISFVKSIVAETRIVFYVRILNNVEFIDYLKESHRRGIRLSNLGFDTINRFRQLVQDQQWVRAFALAEILLKASMLAEVEKTEVLCELGKKCTLDQLLDLLKLFDPWNRASCYAILMSKTRHFDALLPLLNEELSGIALTLESRAEERKQSVDFDNRWFRFTRTLFRDHPVITALHTSNDFLDTKILLREERASPTRECTETSKIVMRELMPRLLNTGEVANAEKLWSACVRAAWPANRETMGSLFDEDFKRMTNNPNYQFTFAT